MVEVEPFCIQRVEGGNNWECSGGKRAAFNDPNPFTSVTTIGYKINNPNLVRILIYTTFGQEVASLFEGYRDVGNYEEIFDGSSLPSGVYYV